MEHELKGSGARFGECHGVSRSVQVVTGICTTGPGAGRPVLELRIRPSGVPDMKGLIPASKVDSDDQNDEFSMILVWL